MAGQASLLYLKIYI